MTTAAIAAASDPRATLRGRLLDGVLAWRDRMLASPAFRDWATGFPLTRPLARRRARALFDLCAGFVYSQVLLAFVRLDVAAALSGGPLDAAALARRLALELPAVERLMRAACALRLAERRGDRYGLGALGAALIGNPGIVAMIEHHAMLYGDLRDPVALLRGDRAATELGRYWPYAGKSAPAGLPADRFGPYTALMAASQPFIASEVLAAHPLGGYRCLLDVGGGDGSFLAAALTRTPGLRGMLVDLPPVADGARARFARDGLAERAVAIAGDFRHGTLPTGADIITLVRVVHDHDDDAADSLLRAAHDALPPGGALLLAEPMADTRGAEPIGDAYFGFYLLAMGSGRPRTAAELTAMLRAAGFASCTRLRTRTPMLTGALLARKCKSGLTRSNVSVS